MSYKAVYARYGTNYFEECDSLEDAINFLEYGSDAGEHFSICIVNQLGTVYTPKYSIDVSDSIPRILNKLKIKFTQERLTFDSTGDKNKCHNTK